MVAIIAIPFLLGVLFSFKIPRRLLIRKSINSRQGTRRTDRRHGLVKFIAGLNFLPLIVYISDCPTVFIMILMTFLMIGLIWLLQTMRRKLKATTIGDFQDDIWGFGQIIAVFIWVPLCLQVVYCALCFSCVSSSPVFGIIFSFTVCQQVVSRLYELGPFGATT